MRYLFGIFRLDAERRELKADGRLVELEPQVFDVLEFLLRHRDRVVGRDELLATVWAGRMVSETAVGVRINAARQAIGDDGKAQRWIKTLMRRGFRFVGDVVQECDEHAQQPRPVSHFELLPPPPRRKVRYCRTADGVNIAYSSLGRGDALIRLPSMFNHLEFDWQNPLRAPLIHALRGACRQIRYDGRGTGMSDRDVATISFDGFLSDIEAVTRELRLSRYGLLGISSGAPIAIAHAARYPERVSHLILHGAYAVGRNRRGTVRESDLARARESLLRHGWGDVNSAYLRAYSSMFMPNAQPEQIRWLAAQQREATSAEVAVRLRRAWVDIDVHALLPKLKVPTLVLHCRHDAIVPYDEGRKIAAAIAGAKFVTIESENHIPQHTEPEWPRFVAEISGFLRGR